MPYKDELKKSMNYLAKDDRIVFIGQGVNYWNYIYGTMNNIPIDKKIEIELRILSEPEQKTPFNKSYVIKLVSKEDTVSIQEKISNEL